MVTWAIFEEELWALFGPTECEDFDEALSRVKQMGSQRSYQKEFERWGNRVHGWIQKALVGTFMSGLKLHPYRKQTVFKWVYKKLSSRFYKPYSVKKCVGKVAYRLKLPEGSCIHSLFHVSLLKKKLGESYQTSNDLPPIMDEGEIVMEKKAILENFWVKKRSNFIEESLVKWCRLLAEEATWEKTEEF